jgi:hypothetical protein
MFKKAEIICLALFAISAFFKIFHWPGASILLILSLTSLSMVYFSIPYLKNISSDTDTKVLDEVEKVPAPVSPINKFSVKLTSVSLALCAIAVLFYFQKWPGGKVLLIIGCGSSAFAALSIFMAKKKSENPDAKNPFFIKVLAWCLLTLLMLVKQTTLG